MTRHRGRPSIYTQELADKICERVAAGETLSKVCRDPDMPDRHTVSEWAVKREDFGAQYARARLQLLDRWADEVSDITDEVPTTKGDVAKARLRVDSRKWLLSKLRPQQYGDRLMMEADVRVTIDAEQLVAEAESLGLSRDLLFGR